MSLKVAQKIKLKKIKDFDTFTKITEELRRFGQINCGLRLWKVAQSAINRPIWSHLLFFSFLLMDAFIFLSFPFLNLGILPQTYSIKNNSLKWQLLEDFFLNYVEICVTNSGNRSLPICKVYHLKIWTYFVLSFASSWSGIWTKASLLL